MVARRRRVAVMGVLSFMVDFLEFVLLASLLWEVGCARLTICLLRVKDMCTQFDA